VPLRLWYGIDGSRPYGAAVTPNGRDTQEICHFVPDVEEIFPMKVDTIEWTSTGFQYSERGDSTQEIF